MYNSAVQLSVTRDNYSGHSKSPWLVVVPRRLSPTGRRQYRRFSTKAAAHSFCTALVRQCRANGEHPVALIDAGLAADAAEAVSILASTGLTLAQAARRLLAYAAPGSVANGQHVSTGGAGAAGVAIGQPAGAGASAPLTLKAIHATSEAAKTHQSASTRRSRASLLRALFRAVPDLAERPVEHITTADVAAALDAAWPHSAHSWNAGRRQLHALFGYAIKRRLVRIENPVTPLEFKRVTEAEITALPPDGLRRLLDSCRPATQAEREAAAALPAREKTLALKDTTALQPYLAICAFAGVRPVECTRLTWADIGWEDNVISVRGANSKTGGTRHIELHPTLRAWLERHVPENPAQPIAPPGCIQLLAAVRRRAGFGPDSPTPWQHDCLRHSYATYYMKAALGDMSRLQLNMGHSGTHLLYTRYMNMRGVTRAAAQNWWQILPTDAPGVAG